MERRYATAEEGRGGSSWKRGIAHSQGLRFEWIEAGPVLTYTRRMDAEGLRKLCLSFPGTTEQIQWGCDLLFKVGGKMYAVTPLEPAPVWLSFKASPDKFAELTERQSIIPAPYLARAQWVALQTRDAVGREELADLLRESYEMVLAKLPKKVRKAIANRASAMPGARISRARKKKVASKKAQRTRRAR